MSAKRIVARIDRWQRTHALGGFPVAVAKKFGDDRASSLAVRSPKTSSTRRSPASP